MSRPFQLSPEEERAIFNKVVRPGMDVEEIVRAAKLEIRTIINARPKCPNCESTQLSWALDIINRSGVSDGQLRANDLSPALILGCDECSETITICYGVQDDLVDAGWQITRTDDQ